MRNKDSHKYKLKLSIRVAILTTFVFIMIISSLCIHYGRHPKTKENINYNYNINEKLNYSVYLKDNEFYEEKVLGENKQYATELIDYINIDYNYNYSSSMSTNTKVSYEITGTIIGEYENKDNGNAELWKKNYVLIDKIDEEKQAATFNISKNIQINYAKYSKEVEKFKSEFKIPIDAYLNVVLKVTYETKLEDNTLTSSTDTMEVKIPLARNTITIDKKLDESRSKNLNESIDIKKDDKLIRIGIIINLVTLALFLILSPHLFISKKTYYDKTLSKILKNYAEIIAEVDSLPEKKDLEILDIKTFDDLVDIEEELKSPILYYEQEKGSISLFTIITDNYVYRYILKK